MALGVLTTDVVDGRGRRGPPREALLPIDPVELTERLERSGFVDVDLEENDYGWAVRARAAGTVGNVPGNS